jgi:hypothetical protein
MRSTYGIENLLAWFQAKVVGIIKAKHAAGIA